MKDSGSFLINKSQLIKYQVHVTVMTYMGFEMNGSHSSLWFWENSGDLPKFTEMLSKLLAVVESRRDILTDQGDPVFVICH